MTVLLHLGRLEKMEEGVAEDLTPVEKSHCELLGLFGRQQARPEKGGEHAEGVCLECGGVDRAKAGRVHWQACYREVIVPDGVHAKYRKDSSDCVQFLWSA